MKSKDKTKGKTDELEHEFLQVMQPRTKKGPSWKDDEPAGPVASTSTGATSESSKKTKTLKPKPEDLAEDSEQQIVQTDAVSDLDWLKRHTKTTLDDLEAPGRVFEQSDDEDTQDVNHQDEQEVR